jgi:ABC-type multidrug transport system ATPase subunit/ABC-type multidrug transport system permease subunit
VLGQELLLGRAVDGDGRLDDDPEVSRQHARIRRDSAGQPVVEDVGSANGTYLNGSRLSRPLPLAVGDTIRLGNTAIRVESYDDSSGQKAAAAPLAAGVAAGSEAAPALAERGYQGTLLYDGMRLQLDRSAVTVGRAKDNTICMASERASRHHARFETTAEGCCVTDLNSRNGTYLNGGRLRAERRLLASGDTVTIGTEPIRFLAGEATVLGAGPQRPVKGTQTIRLEADQLTIGRDAANDVVLEDPNVSRFHAEVVSVPDGWELRDLGSRNGTRLNGSLIERAGIQIGSEIGIGPFRLIFDGAAFVARDDRGLLRLAADQVTIEVAGGKRILDSASLEIPPGDFVAIIGEAGSGKTTLLKGLAGVITPTSGAITVSGEPVSARLSEIGYVPQDEIVHRELTAREALTYAARLRLPQDSSDEEIRAAVDDVLAELAMEEHAETRVGSLSGGQRKRAGFGTELVNRPGLLFLDEVTTGLDPGLERRLMELMRELAGARTVITITHATKNLSLCDKVVIMGRGGHLSFVGAPDEALRFFGVSDYDQIYTALDTAPAGYWPDRWLDYATQRALQRGDVPPSPPTFARPKADRKIGRQARILASRYLLLFRRDRRNLIILLGQVPVLAILVSLLFHRNVMQYGNGQSNSAIQLIFLLLVVVVWCASISSAREIIRERAIFERERAVGVRNAAYLLSKSSVLFSLALIQTVVLAAIVLALRPLHEPSHAYVVVIALLVLSSWVAVMIGLLLSATVNTENQATSFIPLILIPELLFAGGIKPLHELPSAVQVFAGAIFPRWSFAALGNVVHFNTRFAHDPQGAIQFQHNGHTFFRLSPTIAAGVLVLFLAVFAFGVMLSLRRER